MHFCVHTFLRACMHAFQVIEMHIGALAGKDSENNRLIIEVLALNGPFIKWGIFKEVKNRTKITWSTVSRRVDDLKQRGYVIETGRKKVRVGRREEDSPTYGLTFKGFITSLREGKVQDSVLVLQKNPQIELPIPREWFSEIVKQMELSDSEINSLTERLVQAIKLCPLDLESSDEGEILWCMFPALGKARFFEVIPGERWNKLLGSQLIREIVLRQEPKLKETLEGIRRFRQLSQAVETPKQLPSSELPSTTRDEQATKSET